MLNDMFQRSFVPIPKYFVSLCKSLPCIKCDLLGNAKNMSPEIFQTSSDVNICMISICTFRYFIANAISVTFHFQPYR